jgi:hypothetical protein
LFMLFFSGKEKSHPQVASGSYGFLGCDSAKS